MKVFVLAGDRMKSIPSYLKDKGLDATCVASLEEDLFSTTINVDKFVIVDSGFDITSNMQRFQRLLSYDFFVTKEIVFIGSKSRTTVEFFNIAINKAKQQANWDVPVRVYVEDVLPLEMIYSYIFNLSKGKTLQPNVYQNVYRQPNEDKVIITDEEYIEDEFFTDKNYKNINRYENIKRQLRDSKNFNVYDNSDIGEPVVKINTDKEFILDRVYNDLEDYSNTVIVCGEEKTGKSVLCSALISSLMKLNKTILMIDAQQNGSTTEILSNYYDINVLRMSDIKGDYAQIDEYFGNEENVVSVINLSNLDDDIATFTFKLLENYYDKYDVILVDLPTTKSGYLDLLFKYNEVLVTGSLRAIDVKKLGNFIDSLQLNKKITVVFNSIFQNFEDIDKLEPPEAIHMIEESFIGDYAYTPELVFNGISANESLALKLIGGVLQDGDSDKTK